MRPVSDYWSLPPVTSSYEPGSTFKLVTLCAAVEEGLYNEKEQFYCSGSVNVAGRKINCWTAAGARQHYIPGGGGELLQPLLSTWESAWQREAFRLYPCFRYGQRSGIDYPGESEGLIFDLEQVGPVELATSSFGQGISATPLQQLMAVSAIANGGNLMKPYLVEKICNIDGEMVYKRKPEIVRQVISRSTAARLPGSWRTWPFAAAP